MNSFQTDTIGVVVPAYNSAATIGRALASIEAQSLPAAEVVVVDDASSDGTAAAVEAILRGAARPGRRLVRCARNGGPAASRNRGVAEIRGEWIAFLDADDAWPEWKLEAQAALAAQWPEAVLFCGGKADRGQALARPTDAELRSLTRPLPLAAFEVTNPVVTSTVLVKRAALAAAGGFDEVFRGPEDFDLWMRIAARGTAMKAETPLAFYDDRAGSLSMSDATFLPQILAVLDKAYGPGGVLRGRGPKRRAQAYHCGACSWMAAERGALGRALWLYARSVVLWPGGFGAAQRARWARVKLLAYLVKRLAGKRME